jgi:hypothetical protein
MGAADHADPAENQHIRSRTLSRIRYKKDRPGEGCRGGLNFQSAIQRRSIRESFTPRLAYISRVAVERFSV